MEFLKERLKVHKKNLKAAQAVEDVVAIEREKMQIKCIKQMIKEAEGEAVSQNQNTI